MTSATTSGPAAIGIRSAERSPAPTSLACRAYGVFAEVASSWSAAIPDHSLRMVPGSMITTLMPNSATSTRRLSLSPSTANLLAWYQLPSGSQILPPMEEMFTMYPSRCARICGSTSW